MDCFMSMWLIKAMQCTSFIQGLTIEFQKKKKWRSSFIILSKQKGLDVCQVQNLNQNLIQNQRQYFIYNYFWCLAFLVILFNLQDIVNNNFATKIHGNFFELNASSEMVWADERETTTTWKVVCRHKFTILKVICAFYVVLRSGAMAVDEW